MSACGLRKNVRDRDVGREPQWNCMLMHMVFIMMRYDADGLMLIRMMLLLLIRRLLPMTDSTDGGALERTANDDSGGYGQYGC